MAGEFGGAGVICVLGKDMKYSSVIGGYYCVLGWISLAGFVVGLGVAYWTNSLYLDLSFVIWLWMGSELRRRSPTARKWAIEISGIVTLFIVAMLVTGAGEARFGSLGFKPGDIRYYLMGAGLFVLLGLPGLLLLSGGARNEFRSNPQGAACGLNR